MRLVRLDGFDARRLGGRGALERTVADFQFDDVLAGGFELLGDGEHRKGRLDRQRLGEFTERRGHVVPFRFTSEVRTIRQGR